MLLVTVNAVPSLHSHLRENLKLYIFQKPVATELNEAFLTFTEYIRSLPFSQEPVTSLYPASVEWSPFREVTIVVVLSDYKCRAMHAICRSRLIFFV
jgi:hypothetical protein